MPSRYAFGGGCALLADAAAPTVNAALPPTNARRLITPSPLSEMVRTVSGGCDYWPAGVKGNGFRKLQRNLSAAGMCLLCRHWRAVNGNEAPARTVLHKNSGCAKASSGRGAANALFDVGDVR